MRLKSALRRGVAAAVIAGIVVSSGIPAYAARWDIANGDITVKAGDAEGKNKVSQGETIDKDDTNTVITGDSLTVLRDMEADSVDMVITDPPYASGGWKPSEKNRTTNQKYSSMDPKNALPDFDGDNRDQRSWTRWMAEWLSDARKACKPGAPVCLFIDWRQYPSITDALQWAGWIWRGSVVWDKMTSRPQKGRFRQQSEYVVWGSNGPMPVNRPVGCLPGVFRYANPQNRIHVTEKPLQLMRDLVKICVPGGRILDPFCGSGTTVLAARLEGYEAVGVEVTDAYYKLGSDRVRFALKSHAELDNAAE